jgi:hypothetical protein
MNSVQKFYDDWADDYHLLEIEDLTLAIQKIKTRIHPGGLFLASIRDYDAVLNPALSDDSAKSHLSQARVQLQRLPGDFSVASRLPTATHPRTFNDENGKRIVFQTWDWDEANTSYAVNQFTLREIGASSGEWKTEFRASRFRAWQRHELTAVLSATGFREVQWQLPDDTGFYQPIVTARG